ncbi:MAG: hypothetical protein MUC81_02410 [Bacteroidia bacterium]|jgi:hypothetical protein|nr:hypothetical protein [Bacteroidia bacterium]
MTPETSVFLPGTLIDTLNMHLKANKLTKYMNQFMDFLIKLMLCIPHYDNEDFDDGMYANVHKKELRKWVKGSYNKGYLSEFICDRLIEWNIIQCDGSYRVRARNYSRGVKNTSKALGYRFNPCLLQSDSWKEYESTVDVNPNLKKNLKRNNPDHSLAIDFLFDLTVDMEAVIKYCYGNMGMRLKPKKDKERWLTYARARHWISLAMKVHLGHHYYKRDGDSRVYSTITSYPSKLKQFLRYKGEPLVNIDIANSQPLLLCLLPGFDDVQYKSDVQNGILYERLMVTAGLSDTIEEAKICFERDLVKTEFFQYVLYKKKGMPFDLEQRVVKAFAYIYPEAFEFIKGLSEKEHLAVQMQKTEADVMIDKVLKDLLIDFVPCVTIHDSVLSVQSNAECISGYILKHFTGGGVIPSLKIEYPSS